ncbi:hypothetical protein THIOM_000587 [Candidatus Thiomargarita nelsonii]|uniref:Uncharacterized protein n=1 Tax=Candidatus Thiomargarita nelsonii TaxID=1003181 RepID=A0A176S6I9_9GAMM|nr:hypothetical protein THIOM_000587 [Candidatus Thiomargarita nelsonii]
MVCPVFATGVGERVPVAVPVCSPQWLSLSPQYFLPAVTSLGWAALALSFAGALLMTSLSVQPVAPGPLVGAVKVFLVPGAPVSKRLQRSPMLYMALSFGGAGGDKGPACADHGNSKVMRMCLYFIRMVPIYFLSFRPAGEILKR